MVCREHYHDLSTQGEPSTDYMTRFVLIGPLPAAGHDADGRGGLYSFGHFPVLPQGPLPGGSNLARQKGECLHATRYGAIRPRVSRRGE